MSHPAARIFLSGPMGSGKSTVAKAVAARTGRPAFDLDDLIETRSGKTIAEVFSERGEQGFRALEREVMRELLVQEPRGVFALGGGTVTDHGLRRELLNQGVLLTLRAKTSELARRVGHGQGRPLLDGQDVAGRLRALLDARAAAYGESHGTIDTDGRDADEIAASVIALADEPPQVVPRGEQTYRIEVGFGIRGRLSERVAAMASSTRMVLVTDQNVGPIWAQGLRGDLILAGREVQLVILAAGEQHKTLASVEQIWQAALGFGIDRGSGVVAVGGGVVGDLGGFAAASLLRGIPIGHVPTSLLAMVDSAVGGKTGFDTAHGKNLIGAFHQPSFVLCDVELLATLPDAERRNGLAEVVKSAWIEGDAAVVQLERDRDALLAADREATMAAIRMSVRLKARIVTEDEREAGSRGLLNLGHTLGHAIEAQMGYGGVRHGEAVSLGMVAAFRVAEHFGAGSAASRERAVRLLSGLGLPTDISPYLKDEVFKFMTIDKKKRGDDIHYVLPGEPGHVTLRALPLREVIAALRA
jgi:shikimate kinase/3-dehydroquinate synthase